MSAFAKSRSEPSRGRYSLSFAPVAKKLALPIEVRAILRYSKNNSEVLFFSLFLQEEFITLHFPT